ncbi:MAG TPA: hypothetical protein VD997_05220 [Phycisphaerales bacterium]|nr:hypothetical protein [Phycisphaerales bacterium]
MADVSRCPECGSDPSVPGPLPWWGRLTGLPLVIATCLLGFCVLMAAVRMQKGTSTIGGAKATGLGMTVGEVRDAAAGELGLQRRLADAILKPAEDFMFTGSAEWEVGCGPGPVQRVDQWAIGFPVQWVTWSSFTQLRKGPALAPMDEWRWFGLTLRWTTRAATGPTSTLLIDLPGLALVLLCVLVIAAVLQRIASCRSRRVKGSAWACGVIALVLLLLWPAHTTEQRYGSGGMPRGVSRNRTRILAKDAEGLASIAVTAAAQLAQRDPLEAAVVEWQMPQNGKMEYTEVGWPRAWGGIGVYAAVPPDEHAGEDLGLRVQQGIFRWRWFGDDGRLRSFAIPAKSVATTLTPVLLLSLGVHWTAVRLQGRRERRLAKENCCLGCGYNVT